MSVATLVTAATVVVIGYRAGRAHAAWKDVREARKAVHITRRLAWAHSVRLAAGLLAIMATLLAVAYDATH